MKRTVFDLTDQTVVALAAENSLGFLEAAFEFYETGQMFAIKRPDATLNALLPLVEEFTHSGPLRRGWAHFKHTARFDDSVAQIVFTSGTEGLPKAIVLSHRNLAEVVTALNSFMGVTNEIREYIGIPVTYSFGLGRARAVAAAGGSIFLPERFDPSEIRTMLEAGEINAISAVPSLWRSVLALPDIIGPAGELVRWIEIGSQYMSGEEKEAMRRLFPSAKIVQHYGLTEASRSTILDVSAGIALESIGRPLGRAEVRLTRGGAIAIRGQHVALGQLGPDGVVQPLTDKAGWLITKDRGEQRDGWLYFLGRLDDQINIAGLKVGAEALENQVAQLVSGVADRFAVTGIADEARGEAVLVAVENTIADRLPLIKAAMRIALSNCGIDGAGALHLMQIDTLPRTGTNKIRRADLQTTYNQRQFKADAAQLSQPDLTASEQALAKTWRRVVGPITINPNQSFYDVGGDSLSSVQMGLIMEAENYSRATVRGTFEGQSLHDVARTAETAAGAQCTNGAIFSPLPDPTVRTWAINVTRGVMVISVLLSHWGTGLFERLGVADFTERYLNLLYRMGTPGFATVFGIGIGFFMLSDFAEKRVSVLRRLRMAFGLVFTGLLLLAMMRLVILYTEGRPLNGITFSGAFYGVLAYYSIALGTAPLWTPVLARLKHPVAILLVAAPLLWLCWKVAQDMLPSERQDNLFEWFRLMTVGGYSVIKMAAITAVGIAAGYWLSKQQDTRSVANTFLLVGGVWFLLSLFSLLEMHGLFVFADRGAPAFGSLVGLTLYISLSVFFLGAFLQVLLRWERLCKLLRMPFHALIVFGGLALPIYVFHELVIPARDILLALGLSGGVSLAIPMIAFLGVIGYSGYRLHRMYFGG